MRLQTLPGKFPTERPLDPDNGSPGTVRTATGAEIEKNVLRRTTPHYRKHSAAIQSTADYDSGTGIDGNGERRAYDVAPRTATLTPLQAIRQKCLWCCDGSAHEVALCPAEACPSWPFRFGRKPTAEIIAGDTLSVLKSIKGKCLDCSGGSKSEVRNCAFTDCALHPFRQGKNPNRTYSPEERARRAEQLAKLKRRLP